MGTNWEKCESFENFWIAGEDEVFGGWEFEVPVGALDELIRLNAELLSCSDYVRFQPEVREGAVGDLSYKEALESHWREHGVGFVLDVRHLNVRLEAGFWDQAVRLTYFSRQGDPISVHIGDCHSLLVGELGLGQEDRRYAGVTPPVYVRSRLFRLDALPGRVKFSVLLKSNIFFPKIRQFYVWGRGEPLREEIDNSLLADENAADFNVWLRALRQVVETRGGRCALRQDLGSGQRRYLRDEGIFGEDERLCWRG